MQRVGAGGGGLRPSVSAADAAVPGRVDGVARAVQVLGGHDVLRGGAQVRERMAAASPRVSVVVSCFWGLVK